MSADAPILTADVLVIGGGPAGSTAAALLAREGRRVVLVDKEKFPRYHIGESLLPGVLPFLDELGAREAVEQIGFHRKTGQTFIWGKDRTPWRLDFTDLDAYPFSWFVERADFDHALLGNARRCGAQILEQHAVAEIRAVEGRVIGAEVLDPEGGRVEIRASYTVDASGQSSILGRRFRLRRFQRGLRNLATWAYWEHPGHLPPPQDQHIFTISVEDGWIWFIPLRNRIASVGLVTSDWTRDRRLAAGDPELRAWYERTVAACEPLRPLLASATRTDPIRSQRDWSYRCARFHGPGYALAGDAACFIDPILSTGVNLGMNGAYLAALAIHSALAEPVHAPVYLEYFQRAYRTLFDEQLASVKHFYKVEAKRSSVYWKSKQLMKVDRKVQGKLAFLFINSGLARHATAHEPHGVAAQARSLFASRLGPPPEAGGGYGPGAPRRRLVPDGEFIFVQGEDRRLFGIAQEGFQLRLAPATPKGMRGRPPGTAFLLELERLPDRTPLGLVLVETMHVDIPAHVRRAGGYAVSYRGYERGSEEERLLGRAAETIVERIGAAGSIEVAELERRLRRELRGAPSTGWAIARPPRALGERIGEQPVVADLARADGASLWLILRPRRPPEIAESPFARTRFVDVEYRLGASTPLDDPGVRAVLSSAVATVRHAVTGRARLDAALAASERAFSDTPGLPAGWAVRSIHRVEPPGG